MNHREQTILYEYYKPIFEIYLSQKYYRRHNFDFNIIINNTFLSIFKNIGQYKNDYIKHPKLNCNNHPKFHAWIFQILRRNVIDYYRRIKRYTTNVIISDKLPETLIPESIDMEYNNILQIILNSLPLKTKNVFTDYIEGYTYKELQLKYNIPYGTAKYHVSIARKIINEKYNILNWSKKYTIK